MCTIHRSLKLKQQHEQGFTLLEIIIVLALIGAIASVVLPALRITADSQMIASIRNFTSQVRAAYDNAVFTGRMQRLVIDLKKSEYWVEQAPPNFKGRPPLFENEAEKEPLLESNRKTFITSMEEKSRNLSKRKSPYSSNEEDPIYYSIRSIPVVQKKVLDPVKWFEVNDSIIFKQTLIGDVVFAKFLSALSKQPYEYTVLMNANDSKKSTFAYIYFLPDGTASPTSIQLGIKTQNNTIAENDAKYTLNLNSLTGTTNLLEGFQDANFKLPKK